MPAFVNNDPLGYIDDLREALVSPNMQELFPATAVPSPDIARWGFAERIAEKNPELPEDAFAIMSSLGFCQLYGITLPEDIERTLSRPLPPELLVPAIVQTLVLLKSATEDARALPDRFDGAEPLEDRSYCTSLLHQLMELWAAYIVIDDEYQQHVCAELRIDSPFGIWMRQLLEAFNSLDDVLQRDEQIRLLSIATELPLLENWRKMLVPPFSEVLPWWLDGMLEDAAEATRRLIEEDSTFSRPRMETEPLTFLNRWHQELNAKAAQFGIAANAGEVDGITSVEWLGARHLVRDEPDVQIRLGRRLVEGNGLELVVALIGDTANKEKYVSVEVALGSSDLRQAFFEMDCATVSFSQNEFGDAVSLTLIDKNGVRRSVDIQGFSYGD